MASSVVCDRFGFFNGVYGIEQSNWANFWKGIIPDGVIAGLDEELEVYAQSDGRKVHVKTGQAIVAGHRCWITSEKEIDIAENTSGANRTDGIFIRVTYGNDGASKMSIVAKTGSTGATRTIGTTYEMLIATVTVASGFVTIAADAVTDKRYVFKLAADAGAVQAVTVSGTTGTVAPQNDREYRTNTALTALTIYLPTSPHATFITGVTFKSGSSINVTFRKGTPAKSTAITPKISGDALTLTGKKYNLVIWWDGNYYWVASKAVTA